MSQTDEPRAAQRPLLHAHGLSKSYGPQRTVFADISVTLESGQAVALLGASGSGKSTLLNVLASIDSADSGEIRYCVDAETVLLHAAPERARTSFRRRHLGFVFQFFNLVPTLTVRENVLLPRRLNQLPKSGDADALARLDELGLAGLHDALPDTCSGGEQQRAAIARALAHEPAMLLADEPTGNLDQRSADEVMELLLRHVTAAGAALIVATHSMRLADRVGQVLQLDAEPAGRSDVEPGWAGSS